MLPLNSDIYNNEGRINAIIADPSEPAIFKKSVKFGTNNDIPVIIQTIIDLAEIYLILLTLGFPSLKN